MTDIALPQSPSDSREVVRSIDEDGNLVFDQVGFQELDFGAVFGGKTTSTSQNSIAYGLQTFTLDIDDGLIVPGCKVEITSRDDTDCWEIGYVISKDLAKSPAAITVFIRKISQLVNTSKNWEIQITDDAAVDDALVGYTGENITIAPGNQSFTVNRGWFDADQAMSIKLTDLTPGTTNWMYGPVVDVTDNLDGTFTITFNCIQAAGIGESSLGWEIAIVNGPVLPSTSILIDTDGAFVRAAITGDVSIPKNSNSATLSTSGVVAATYGDSSHVPQIAIDAKGRITSATAIAITASSIGSAPDSADYLVKTANAGLSAERVVTDTATVTWDWSTGGQAKASFTGSGYVPTTTTVNGHALSANVTVTTSDIGAVPTSTTVNGHALSANVTVAYADLAAGALANGTTATTQSAADNSTKVATTAYADRNSPLAVFDVTVTPAQISGNLSSVASNVATWSQAHGLTTGQQVSPLAGTWSGVTLGQVYPVNVISNLTFTFHNNLDDAKTGANPVVIAAGSGTRTLRSYTCASARNNGLIGLDTACPVGFNPGTTTMEPLLSLASAPSVVPVPNISVNGLADATGVTSRFNVNVPVLSNSNKTITYSNAAILTVRATPAIASLTTLANQANNAFRLVGVIN